MQDAKRLARGCEATENAMGGGGGGSGGMPPGIFL